MYTYVRHGYNADTLPLMDQLHIIIADLFMSERVANVGYILILINQLEALAVNSSR